MVAIANLISVTTTIYHTYEYHRLINHSPQSSRPKGNTQLLVTPVSAVRAAKMGSAVGFSEGSTQKMVTLRLVP